MAKDASEAIENMINLSKLNNIIQDAKDNNG